MASNSPVVTPVINRESFKDMLAEEANFTPSLQPRCVKFTDTVQGQLTSTPCNLWEEVALPPKPPFQGHAEEIGLHAAAQEFQKMQEPKMTSLKGGYTLSAGLVFQSWLKDICVHVEYR